MAVRLTSAVVQIFAKDVQRSIAFYRLLGLPVPEPEGADPHVAVELPGGNQLSFDAEQTITGMHPDWVPSDSAGRVALAFGLGSPAEVDAMFRRLTAAGHPGPLEPYDAPWRQRYATVLDPDRNMVDLFAPLTG
ncbi:MAG TPA: VOC family protein [Streptosporangiaceae bacterium]|jgi:catechol 2,3-dioxygenase-like lactoylglutathione lyase family enzyme